MLFFLYSLSDILIPNFYPITTHLWRVFPFTHKLQKRGGFYATRNEMDINNKAKNIVKVTKIWVEKRERTKEKKKAFE